MGRCRMHRTSYWLRFSLAGLVLWQFLATAAQAEDFSEFWATQEHATPSNATAAPGNLLGTRLVDHEQPVHSGLGCCPRHPLPPGTFETRPPSPPPVDGRAPSPPMAEEAAPSPFAATAQAALVTPESIAATSNVGYIDLAVPVTQFRLRFDAAINNPFPDRAEFFYAKCGCFRTLPAGNPQRDPDAPGPPRPESSVDYQDLRPYLEYALSDRFSVFGEFPVRFLDPVANDNTAGYADMNAGFKYALLADPDRYLTFQFSTYIPTGDADRGLGTDHVSLEPAVLFYRRLSRRWILEAEFRDWVPVGGTDFAGNVLRYGAGLSYLLSDTDRLTIAPVTEVVGWTALDGRKSRAGEPVQSADGDTIVNLKLGVRFGFDGLDLPLAGSRSLYAGWGTALTNENVWYEDIFRLEYRVLF